MDSYTKRQRTDDGYSTAGRRDSFDTNHKLSPQPSCVVHVRGLTDSVTVSDIEQAVQQFGRVSYVSMIENRRMALIEFDDISGATNLVTYSETTPIFLRGKQAFFNYSTSSRIKRHGATDDDVPPNRVLLLTIVNPKYPITIDVLYAITSPIGNVARIVIFRKNGVQAMVEFENLEVATKAKSSLNNADIYSGCCTVMTAYAKPEKLNVRRNDNDFSWDFTVPNAVKAPSPQAKNQPLLADPLFGTGPIPFMHGSGMMGSAGNMMGMSDYARRGTGMSSESMDYSNYGASGGDNYTYGGATGSYGAGTGFGSGAVSGFGTGAARFGGVPAMNQMSYDSGSYDGGMVGKIAMQPHCVVMVYGLHPQKMNCNRVFNLFCQYGNVIRVKFLKTKEGSAMVQLGDSAACERGINLLNSASIFGHKLQLALSKQDCLHDVNNPHTLPDGSCAFADMTTNRNNRYMNPTAGAKNRPMHPTSTLYFFNVPPSITENALNKLFEETGAAPPDVIKIFPPKSEKSSRGLLHWYNSERCIEALVCTNHVQIPSETGKGAFVMKLCFTNAPMD